MIVNGGDESGFAGGWGWLDEKSCPISVNCWIATHKILANWHSLSWVYTLHISLAVRKVFLDLQWVLFTVRKKNIFLTWKVITEPFKVSICKFIFDHTVLHGIVSNDMPSINQKRDKKTLKRYLLTKIIYSFLLKFMDHVFIVFVYVIFHRTN